ncbi:hypothetical protein MJT46_010995 [Ovis ammon polii x Ovis aries]|nr:hypothetical protein MJT46_010995 [Ovis ammon polii x Ovis aries]
MNSRVSKMPHGECLLKKLLAEGFGNRGMPALEEIGTDGEIQSQRFLASKATKHLGLSGRKRYHRGNSKAHLALASQEFSAFFAAPQRSAFVPDGLSPHFCLMLLTGGCVPSWVQFGLVVHRTGASLLLSSVMSAPSWGCQGAKSTGLLIGRPCSPRCHHLQSCDPAGMGVGENGKRFVVGKPVAQPVAASPGISSSDFLDGSALLFRGWAPGAVMILGEQEQGPSRLKTSAAVARGLRSCGSRALEHRVNCCGAHGLSCFMESSPM